MIIYFTKRKINVHYKTYYVICILLLSSNLYLKKNVFEFYYYLSQCWRARAAESRSFLDGTGSGKKKYIGS